ncbi:MAG TPA: aminotransferase class V-fold PLP-dependent enzyme [Pyrinomonadaceae bacterium]|nr:aminotransferase class V-fold PLP-dependent enzyme [Pyrinomonadaceae bacterium]
MNEQIRSFFPITRDTVYLNSAAVAPLPTTAIEAVNWQMNDVAMNGTRNYTDWVATKDRCRVLLSSMLGVEAEQVAFVRNTSDGFSTIANGLKWNAGDNVVSFVGEFPANFYPWRRIRDEFGVELRLVDEIDGRVDIDGLIAAINGNTRVVAISAVQFASGFRADLGRIAVAAHAVDALVCVDTIQAIGACGLDLPALGVDAACGASHKWLCAPEGCGYIYLSDRGRERVSPTLTGWISVEDPWDFVDREQSLKSTALAWESGTGPASLFYGLEQSLKLLTEAGLGNIERHLQSLSDQLCDSIDSGKYEIVSSRIPGEASQIVCIRNREGLHPNALAKQLEAENIVVSPRIDRLRIAPHLFNTSEDIERLVAALP